MRPSKHITKAVAIQTGRTAKEIIRNDDWDGFGLGMSSSGEGEGERGHTREHVEAGKSKDRQLQTNA